MTTQTRIEELARSKLLGKRIDPIGFVDELLALASREGEIRCTFAGNDALRFTISDPQGVFEVPVDRARGKLRMMCARLATLCHESGQEFLPYGGEGIIRKGPPLPVPAPGLAASGREVRAVPPSQIDGRDVLVAAGNPADGAASCRDEWKVRFKNTIHEHEFIIEKA